MKRYQYPIYSLSLIHIYQADYDEFTTRHGNNHVKTGDLSTYKGNCYLGIDAGSTTTKIALVSEDGDLLYSFYSNNNGSPLATAIRSIQEIYSKLPEDAHIVHYNNAI